MDRTTFTLTALNKVRCLSLLILLAAMPTAQAESWLSSGSPYPEDRPKLTLETGSRTQEAPKSGLGTVIRGSRELPLLRMGGKLRGSMFAASIIYPLGIMGASQRSAESMAASSWPGTSLPFFFARYRYYNAEKQQEAVEPVGGDNVGSTYAINNPASNSTGVFVGANGLHAESDSEIDTHKFELGFGSSFKLSKTILTPKFSVFYESLDHTAGAWVTSPSFTMDQYSQTTDLGLEGDRYGFGVDLGVSGKLTPKLTLGGNIGLGAVYYENDLRFRQYNVCGACGMASPEYRYNVMIDDSDSGFTYQGRIGVSAMYELQKNFELGIGFDQEFYGDVAKLDSRDNPNQPVSHLTDEDVSAWNVKVGMRVSF
jgi:hypothetical protein